MACCDWHVSRLAPLLFAAAAVLLPSSQKASALSIELKDVAPDRIERQRAAESGSLPLPGTPDIVGWQERLSEKGIKVGAPIFIRAFKAESQMEVWMQKGGEYVLFATYPVCHWSGTLGPKLREGDKQTPEGFYTVTRTQIFHAGRWPQSLNLGFPNIYDQSQARTGSHILIHGGCSSIGCFAMTNPVMDQIYALTKAALATGQKYIPVHVFPFRMTEANMASAQGFPWIEFWQNLKEGYDAFEKTRIPPRATVCENRYKIEELNSIDPPAGSVYGCLSTLAEIKAQQQWLNDLPRPKTLAAIQRNRLQSIALIRALPGMPVSKLGGPIPPDLLPNQRPLIKCSLSLPSCRKFIELQRRGRSAKIAREARAAQRRKLNR